MAGPSLNDYCQMFTVQTVFRVYNFFQYYVLSNFQKFIIVCNTWVLTQSIAMSNFPYAGRQGRTRALGTATIGCQAHGGLWVNILIFDMLISDRKRNIEDKE